jgi:Tol biopolymer transport system component
VAFVSDSNNLVSGDTNGFSDVFVHDRDADGNGTYDEPGGISTVRVSVLSDGSEGNGDSSAPSISSDGRYITFESMASNLVDNDTNGNVDVFVHDRDADGNGTYDEPGGISTVRVSVLSDGSEGNGDSSAPSISSDGKLVTFESEADNLVASDGNGSSDIFTYENESLPLNTTQSEQNNSSGSGPCFISTALSD